MKHSRQGWLFSYLVAGVFLCVRQWEIISNVFWKRVWFALQVNPVLAFEQARFSFGGGIASSWWEKGRFVRYRWVPKKNVYTKQTKESILARGFLRGKPFDSTSMRILWEYFGFKETSLDVKDCRIEPEFVQKDGFFGIRPLPRFGLTVWFRKVSLPCWKQRKLIDDVDSFMGARKSS